MSPPLLGVEGQNQYNDPLMASFATPDCISQSGNDLQERNYLGLSGRAETPVVSNATEGNNCSLNLKATELRLGLPGCQSPERDSEFSHLSLARLDEKHFFPLVPSKDGTCASLQKTFVSGNKRGFCATVDGFSETKNTIFTEVNWGFNAVVPDPGQPKPAESVFPNRPSGTRAGDKADLPVEASQDCDKKITGTNINIAPAAKAQVVGWPPIRSSRKNTLPTNSKNNDEVDGKPGPGSHFVKVGMDGAPYLRKVDLRIYSTYQELSSDLEKMFSCFTIMGCGPQAAPSKEMLSESKLNDFLHGSEYVLTYEDKDGDWMLVGDVPWGMFTVTCKRLKIMKGTDAIGLAPRFVEKSKKGN